MLHAGNEEKRKLHLRGGGLEAQKWEDCPERIQYSIGSAVVCIAGSCVVERKNRWLIVLHVSRYTRNSPIALVLQFPIPIIFSFLMFFSVFSGVLHGQ